MLKKFLLIFCCMSGAIFAESVLQHLELGTEALQEGHLDEAMLHAEKGLQEAPEFPPLIALLANTMDKSGNQQGALRELKKAIQLDPNNASYYLKRAEIFEKIGALEAAYSDLEKSRALLPI